LQKQVRLYFFCWLEDLWDNRLSPEIATLNWKIIFPRSFIFAWEGLLL
jgi:hypothetical protein